MPPLYTGPDPLGLGGEGAWITPGQGAWWSGPDPLGLGGGGGGQGGQNRGQNGDQSGGLGGLMLILAIGGFFVLLVHVGDGD